jgi:hypothetical protein
MRGLTMTDAKPGAAGINAEPRRLRGPRRLYGLIRNLHDGKLYGSAGSIGWAVLVNLVNVWLVRALVEDLAVVGVFIVLLLTALWLSSVPRRLRRCWLVFTVFSLLVGQAWSAFTVLSVAARIGAGVLALAILSVLARWLGRVPVSRLFTSALVLAALNTWLPEDLWPFLTHFRVVASGRLEVDTGNYPVLPLTIVKAFGGEAVITVTKWPGRNGDATATVADEVLKKLPPGHIIYQYVQLAMEDGHIVQRPATPQELAQIPASYLVNAFAPFDRSSWQVVGDQLLAFTVRTESSVEAIARALQPTRYDSNLAHLVQVADQSQWHDWQHALERLGVSAGAQPMRIERGMLIGHHDGHRIHVQVAASLIIGSGSFTHPGAHELLVAGANRLQVVSLDEGTGRVVATYNGPIGNPVGGDITVGPIDGSGRDAIFVNASPAYILQVTVDGRWQRVYTAPNAELQFLGSICFPGEARPEILTDDRSQLRTAATTYFTSYTFQSGQLYRNWRVYQTGVENLREVQFVKGGATYLVAALAGQGRYVVLARHHWPIMPLTVGLLVVALIIGWGIRLWERRPARE